MKLRRQLVNIAIIAVIILIALMGSVVSAQAGNKLLVSACAPTVANANISYFTDNGTTRGIGLSSADGSQFGCLVEFNKAYGYAPEWSADGRYLGVVMLDSSNPNVPAQYIYIISADASSIRQIVSANQFAWAPDGQHIAFAKDGDIWVTNIENNKPRNITNTRSGAFSPTWSPDGKFIAFSQPDGIYTIEVANGANRRNLSNAANDQYPVWSPDGQSIAFLRREGLEQIYVANVATGALKRVSDGKTLSSEIVWSPDSKSIAYLSAPNRKTFKDTRIMIVGVDGSSLRRLTNETKAEMNPAWSFDGQHVVYEVDLNKKSNHKVFVIGVDGSGKRQLVNSAGFENSPVWRRS